MRATGYSSLGPDFNRQTTSTKRPSHRCGNSRDQFSAIAETYRTWARAFFRPILMLVCRAAIRNADGRVTCLNTRFVPTRILLMPAAILRFLYGWGVAPRPAKRPPASRTLIMKWKFVQPELTRLVPSSLNSA